LELTIADGLVSGIRQYGAFPLIQTSAPVSKGSSGGGLFDTSGRLVGITTGSLIGGQQINIAVVSDLIPLLPSRGASAATKSYASSPPVTAKDLNERPAQDSLANAKTVMQKSSAEWQACSSSAKAIHEGIGIMQERMQSLRAVGRTDEYNALVPVHNAEVERLRQINEDCGVKHRAYVADVDRHNVIVNQINSR
jgi:hypothetical protein